ncbi:MAG: N-6 DNA methylase [Asgard group archaeon]|nr:N-6 DNA methylase [Asgard group archaeon]
MIFVLKKMPDASYNNKSINDDFLADYKKIISSIKTKIPSATDELLYYIIKEELLRKFIKDKELTIEDIIFIPDEIRGSKLYNQIFSEYSNEIKFDFLDRYQYKFSLEISNKNVITPLIFSTIYENSMLVSFKQQSGSYYTSDEEVGFMCREALFQFLLENTTINYNSIYTLIWDLDDLLIKKENILPLKDAKEILNLLQNIRILDPAAGTGAFLIGMVEKLFLLRQYLNEIIKKPQVNKKILIQEICFNNIFGMDINPEALEICKLILFLQLLNLEKDEQINISNSKYNLILMDSILEDPLNRLKISKFDIIISNPPFIRQEQLGNISKDSVSVKQNYKQAFLTNLKVLNKELIPFQVNMKSDLYIYFFVMSLKNLKEQGIICFITSNSWLDVKYGMKFQEFLLKNYHLKVIYSLKEDKSFRAAVNTAITIITNPIKGDDLSQKQTHFVSFKQPYNNEILVKIRHFIENSFSFLINDYLTVITKTQMELIDIGSRDGKYYGEKWGSIFLRAPDIFQTILLKCSDKLCLLSDLGKIRYPIKTGINDFFILDSEKIKQYDIENEFLIPLLKSPKKITHIPITDDSLKSKLFLCNLTLEELQKQNKVGALKYIKWGSEQKNMVKQQISKIAYWPEVPSVQKNKPAWYSITKPLFSDIFCNRFFDRRFFFSYPEEPIIEDQTFYGLILKDSLKKKKELILALLNSTLSFFFLEIFGRSNLGKGALQFALFDYDRLFVINPEVIPNELEHQILDRFNHIKKREIYSIFKEFIHNDRVIFDKIIFDWLGITDDETEIIYESLKELVTSRLVKSGQKIS